MEKKKIDLNEIVDDDHPQVIIEVNSLSRQIRVEESDRKDMRLYGRCGTVSVNGPKKYARGFAEYADVRVDDIFDKPRDHSFVEDSASLILKHITKIRLLARDLDVSPGYLKLLEILEESTKGIQEAGRA